mmetsp:Transcript_6964/g.18894  ORF Transcript_6964/g.18894 Transcript_6964/m.18894 type:complete len:223 (-) Transcript_6964:286-954(-)
MEHHQTLVTHGGLIFKQINNRIMPTFSHDLLTRLITHTYTHTRTRMYVQFITSFLAPTAAAENGTKIMAMLYLTPVLPLGLVSYMCGTTSMPLYSFVVAKIASLPLYLIYTFLGASAHAFIKKDASEPAMVSASDQAKQLEENQSLIVGGIILSIVMMTLITRTIKRELMTILDAQKKEDKPAKQQPSSSSASNVMDEADAVEMGLTARRRQKLDTNVADNN